MENFNSAKGLRNLGNTCYMNSCLQCLVHIPKLKEFFLTPLFKNSRNLLLPSNKDPDSENSFSLEFSKFFQNYYLSQKSMLSPSSHFPQSYFLNESPNCSIKENFENGILIPSKLKNEIGRRNSIFKGYQQQDSSELLVYILDTIHEEVNLAKISIDFKNSNNNNEKEMKDNSGKDEESEILKKVMKIYISNCKEKNVYVNVDDFIQILKEDYLDRLKEESLSFVKSEAVDGNVNFSNNNNNNDLDFLFNNNNNIEKIDKEKKTILKNLTDFISFIKFPNLKGSQEKPPFQFKGIINALPKTYENINLFNANNDIRCVEDVLLDNRTLSRLFWAFFLSNNDSFIINNFYFQLKSEICCDVCGFKSVTFDPTSVLFLNFKNSNSERKRFEGNLINEKKLEEKKLVNIYLIFENNQFFNYDINKFNYKITTNNLIIPIEISEKDSVLKISENIKKTLKNFKDSKEFNNYDNYFKFIKNINSESLEKTEILITLVNNSKIVSILENYDTPFNFTDNGNIYAYLFQNLDESKERLIPLYCKWINKREKTEETLENFINRKNSNDEINNFYEIEKNLLMAYKYPILLRIKKENFLENLIIEIKSVIKEMFKSLINDLNSSDKNYNEIFGEKVSYEGNNFLLNEELLGFISNIINDNFGKLELGFFNFTNDLCSLCKTKNCFSCFSEHFRNSNKYNKIINNENEVINFLQEDNTLYKEKINKELNSVLNPTSVTIFSFDPNFLKITDAYKIKKVVNSTSNLELINNSTSNLELIKNSTSNSKLNKNLTSSNLVNNHFELKNLIKGFLETEILSSNENIKCTKCTNKYNNSKSFEIWNPPEVLIICLKRFAYGSRGRKISNFVDFPIENFDITDSIHQSEVKDISSNERVIYDLCAVSCHHGSSLNFGHYTSYAKVGSKWMHFNDENVSEVETINKNDAFILFYSRKYN